jgi:hypothetical protein
MLWRRGEMAWSSRRVPMRIGPLVALSAQFPSRSLSSARLQWLFHLVRVSLTGYDLSLLHLVGRVCNPFKIMVSIGGMVSFILSRR